MTTERSPRRAGSDDPARSVLRGIRWLGVSGALIVLAALVAQFMPLTNVPGYEFAALMQITLAVAGTLRVAWRRDDDGIGGSAGGTTWRRFRRAAADLAALAGIALVVSLLNGFRVSSCDPLTGLVLYLLLPLMGIPLFVAVGLSVGLLRRRWARVAVVCTFLFVSLVSTLLYLFRQPAIVAWDFFFGYFAGSIYDESLVGFGGHAIYRLWTTAFAVFLLSVVAFVESGVRRAPLIAGLAATILLAMFITRGDLGLHRSRGWVEAELGGVAHTEHFDVYFDRAAVDDEELALMLWDHESRYAELREFWGREPGRLRSYVYPNDERRGQLMGGRSTYVAKIWLGEMHITWDGPGDELLAHEMAHLFLREDGRGPLRLSSRDGLLPLMGLVEGAATAAAWGSGELSYHGWAAALHELDLAPDLADALRADGFWSQSSSTVYTLFGSFSRYLIDTEGPERFLAAYRDGDFEAAYGRGVEVLVSEWRAFLASEPLSEGDLAAARFRYDRPSIFGRRCARAVATRFERGTDLLRGNEVDRGVRCLRQAIDDDPNNLNLRLGAASAMSRVGAWPQAREMAESVARHEGASIGQQSRALRLLGDADAMAGQMDAALAQWRRAAELPGAAAGRRALRARISAFESEGPLTRGAVFDALIRQPSPSAHVTSSALVDAAYREKSALAAYLAGLRLAGSGDSSPAAAMLEAALRGQLRGELTEDQRLQALESLAMHRSIRRPTDDACALWQELADTSSVRSARRSTAEMWLGRCARGELETLNASAF